MCEACNMFDQTSVRFSFIFLQRDDDTIDLEITNEIVFLLVHLWSFVIAFEIWDFYCEFEWCKNMK